MINEKDLKDKKGPKRRKESKETIAKVHPSAEGAGHVNDAYAIVSKRRLGPFRPLGPLCNL